MNKTWRKMVYKEEFTYLVMPHIEEEAYLLMNNLMTFPRYEYSEDVLKYFTSTAKSLSINEFWDPDQKWVVCTIDTNTGMKEEEDELGFDKALEFMEVKNVDKTTNRINTITWPELDSTNQSNLKMQ